jgi:hypothetical protein
MSVAKLAAALTGAAVLFWAGEVVGQARCFPRAEVAGVLAETHHERQVAAGTSGEGDEMVVVEVWASASGTFSIFVTTAAGQSCPLFGGENFSVKLFRPPTESH